MTTILLYIGAAEIVKQVFNQRFPLLGEMRP
jgi:hypothetical protein